MQIYHTNAVTNIHVRSAIQASNLSLEDLSCKYSISKNCVSKWRNRTFTSDVSSRPKNISYALNDIQKELIKSIRKASWLSVDEIHEMVNVDPMHAVSRSSVYRTLVNLKLNTIPPEKKEIAKKFKAYDPGYLHIDVTYLPKFDGSKYYLYVAIDRATRLLFYNVYENKTAKSASDFLLLCKDFFPFYISHVLTDNGLEFTNELLRSKKGNPCSLKSQFDKICNEFNIEHRLTKPATPKTNGMVERVNGIIKTNTIMKNLYTQKEKMFVDLDAFLINYNLYRRHGSLRKELDVKTPYDAMMKWFNLSPDLFKVNPDDFKITLLNLRHINSHFSQLTL